MNRTLFSTPLEWVDFFGSEYLEGAYLIAYADGDVSIGYYLPNEDDQLVWDGVNLKQNPLYATELPFVLDLAPAS